MKPLDVNGGPCRAENTVIYSLFSQAGKFAMQPLLNSATHYGAIPASCIGRYSCSSRTSTSAPTS